MTCFMCYASVDVQVQGAIRSMKDKLSRFVVTFAPRTSLYESFKRLKRFKFVFDFVL